MTETGRKGAASYYFPGLAAVAGGSLSLGAASVAAAVRAVGVERIGTEGGE
jgi:hypothetical protein